MASEQNNRGAFLIQQHYCDANAAPIYGRMCAAVAAGLTRDTAMGARILDWPGEPTRDALPLRFLAGCMRWCRRAGMTGWRRSLRDA
ncbi:hypothetical protein [Sphingomonas sp. Ant H11]|uniref:hypothetical protein n=1 Tax=Sphingomonas sp. Ant H11 TaxID=1564113 RepID=UPI000A4C61BF|nr:hypothetical protein [Sphingomonas sp. Ant H11]